jgi:DNA-binding transcriptional LysR family regulator
MRSLECLVAVVDQGSLTKAATVLHLSQPALSHQIAAIERELRTPVIERLPRGTKPTAAGLAIAAEARVVLAAAARAVTAARRVAAGASGRIRIACVPSMTEWTLVPVLRHWHYCHPQVALDLLECTDAGQMLDVLLAGQVDIAVGPRPASTDEHVEVLGREEIVVVASPYHRFAALDAVPLRELTIEPLVEYDADEGMAAWFTQLAAVHGVVPPKSTVRGGSAHTAARLAQTGVGVTIVPASVSAPLAEATVRPLDPPESRDVIAIVAAPHDELIRRFIADLRRPRAETTSWLPAHRGDTRPSRQPEHGDGNHRASLQRPALNRLMDCPSEMVS